MTGESRFDVPGTPVFDGESSRRGYPMNKMFMSFRDAAARERFLAGEEAYCDSFGLSPEQKAAVLGRDWQGMIDLGASIFYMYKLAMMEGRSMQYLGGVFSGVTEEEFVAAMRRRGQVGG